MRLEDLIVDGGEPLEKGVIAWFDGVAWRLVKPTAVGQLLQWDGSQWVPVAGNATKGQLLQWDGAKWVATAGAAAIGEYLRWNGSYWVPQTPWPDAYRARVYRAAALTVPHAVWTWIAHDTVAENVGGFTFTSNQLRVPVAGWYQATWLCTLAPFTATQIPAAIRFRYSIMNADGTTAYGPSTIGGVDVDRAGLGSSGSGWTELFYMTAGQWVKVEVLLATANSTSGSLQTGNLNAYLRLIRIW